jgi:S-DNA-T family DNA segregation ATPase FtsK/SpoIIIE
MSFENEYKTKNTNESEVIDSITDNKKKRKEKKIENKNVVQSETTGNFISTFRTRWDSKKTTVIFGAFTIFLSFYITIGCVSYLFTWKSDQSEIINKGFWEYLFESNIEQVSNWNGKIGAWISHLLIYDLFGISAFAIPFVSFLLGVKLLVNTHLLPLRRTTIQTTIWMLFGSLFLGYFSNYINFVGGKFGFYTNHWLTFTVGSFFSFVFIILVLYSIIVSLYNPNFGILFNGLYNRFVSSEDDENEDNLEDDIEDENRIRIKKTIVPDEFYTNEQIEEELPENEFISKIPVNSQDNFINENNETNSYNDDFLTEIIEDH